MATWKKLVVSGSDISQLNNDAGYISASQVPAATPSFQSASFNGIDLIADSTSGSLNFASGSTGLNIVATAGTDTLTFDLVAVPNSSLANSSVHVSGSGISAASVDLGATASIDVQVDDSTIEIASDSLQVKDGGVTFAKLADALVVTSGEGIAGNDNDTTIATNAAIIDFVESASSAAGALTVSGSGGTGTSIDLDTQALDFVGSNGIALSASAQTITATINDGGIANAKLANDSIRLDGGNGLTGDGSIALGGTGSLAVGAGDGISVSADAVSVNTGSTHFTEGVRGKISAADTTGAAGIDMSYDASTGTISGSLVNSSITIGNDTVDLGGSTTLAATGFNSGSFSGSFQGDGSQLTGIATSLDVSGSNGTGITIDLKTQDLQVNGTANEIETTVAGTTLTIGLPDDVTITQDLTVNRNLTVVGTASFQHETNLEVSDRFIRMASGSSAAGDGGIVIQQSADGTGEVFGFENSVSRWAVSSSFDGSDSTFNAEAYMAAVLEGSADTATAIASAVPDSKYNAKGNIWISDSENIWIYS